MLTCAILDTGVDLSHKAVIGKEVFGFTLSGEEGCIRSENFQDTYGHGTAIFNILQDLKEEVELINIKIESVEQHISEKAVIGALKYLEQNYHVDVINMSLGTTICEQEQEFYDICRQLDEKGVILVAAFDNEGAMSFPAAFDCVIGVISYETCTKTNEFVYFNDECINVGAKGNLQRLAWTKPQYVFMAGNSFACAHVTKQVLRFLIQGIRGRENILYEFSKIAAKIYEKSEQETITEKTGILPLPDITGKAALFPFNKEMHSLIRFHHLLPFTIEKIYDNKYTGHVSSDTQRIMKDNNVIKIPIENIDEIDFNSFEIFILGHTGELVQVLKNNFTEILLNKLKDNKKKIISFDEIEGLDIEYGADFYCPSIHKEAAPINRMGKLYRISKPVLGVFGTSSQQGKFTLQLKLRELLMKEGYQVGQIGTEPHSLLFGMDVAFPIGYNPSVYLNDWDTVLYLNYQIHQLCRKGNDIIIVGSQAGTIPYDNGNLERYTFRQHTFLMATCPDAVILVINPYDAIDYVIRTIKYMESLENTKVIALMVFPMDIDDNWLGLGQKKPITEQKFHDIQKLYQDFKIPIFLLGNNTHMKMLLAEIINYFSEESEPLFHIDCEEVSTSKH